MKTETGPPYGGRPAPFGLNAMELATAIRHNLAVLVVISLNGGWTADPGGDKPGRELGLSITG